MVKTQKEVLTAPKIFTAKYYQAGAEKVKEGFKKALKIPHPHTQTRMKNNRMRVKI